MRCGDLARFVLALGAWSAGLAGPGEAQSRVSQGPAAPALDVSPLDVPYLPQTGVLCGGAALAMVFRHLGDRRVTVDEFLPLVDEAAGGIADDVLVAEVRRRGWHALRPEGTLARLAEHLARGEPPILLIEDRPDYYHYVVAVGMDDRGVILHDPAWGPARRLRTADFLREWDASGRWMLVIRPGTPTPPAPPPTDDRFGEERSAETPCGVAVDRAIADMEIAGHIATERRLEQLRRECPDESRPISELAALRFAARDWVGAEQLAGDATRISPEDRYAWEVLAASRFVQDDPRGALEAWNRVGRPRIDLLEIEGLRYTRYAIVAEVSGLKPGQLLSAEALSRAERRLSQLPTVEGVRVGYRPAADGLAVVDAAIVERSFVPASRAGWAAFGLRGAIDREIAAALPGPSGQGELWSAGWRWWERRPRVWLTFAAPRAGDRPAVWRLELSREQESYSTIGGVTEESRLRGAFAVERWVTSSRSYQLAASVDRWDRGRRTLSLGGGLTYLFGHERVTLAAAAAFSAPAGPGRSFSTANAQFVLRLPRLGGVDAFIRTGLEAASARAPLALWPGAGTGHGRTHLLRAHPLLSAGVISGPAFGRLLRYLTIEASRPLPGRLGSFVRLAGFADAVAAGRRLETARGRPAQVDAGLGLRIGVPGRTGAVRVDYGRGLVDGADALSIGWTH